MRTGPPSATASAVAAIAVTLLLAGCGDGSPTADATGASPTSASASPVPAGASAEVLLPEGAFAPRDGGREVTEGVEAWALSTSCDLGTPSGAESMTSVRQGDGQFEVPVGLQQLAVYADAASARAEAQRIATAARTCADTAAGGPGEDGGNTRYLVEEVPVGADGVGIATDYYGATAGDPAPETAVIGDYAVVTRRGTAVTLVAESGGEDSTDHARGVVQPLAQQAWERLCASAVAGC